VFLQPESPRRMQILQSVIARSRRRRGNLPNKTSESNRFDASFESPLTIYEDLQKNVVNLNESVIGVNILKFIWLKNHWSISQGISN
jgi:hypothetical protein